MTSWCNLNILINCGSHRLISYNNDEQVVAQGSQYLTLYNTSQIILKPLLHPVIHAHTSWLHRKSHTGPTMKRGAHGGRVVALSPPTSEAGVRFLHGLKWESWQLLAIGRQFTVQNPNELYVLVSSALPTTRRDMTCTVLKAT